MLKKKFPNSFQGNLHKKNYFEGWYNKIVNFSQDHIYSFIPTISLDAKSSHSAIQIFDGYNAKYYYIKYPLSSFRNFSNEHYHIKLGNSIFSEKGMVLEIDYEDLYISGIIDYSNLIKWPRRFLQPGVMGWLSYIPFLETYHGIVSMNHKLKGFLKVNGQKTIFNGGKGYIEKDWGKSFPSAWIWMHSNHFSNENTSFVFSIAKIPLFSFKVTGFFSVLWFNGRIYTFTTYNGSRIENLSTDEKSVSIILSNRKYRFVIKAFSGKKMNMKAPIRGSMKADCIESMNSKILIELYQKEKNKNLLITKDIGSSSGLEIMDNGVFKKP
jgi:hypothetical protein